MELIRNIVMKVKCEKSVLPVGANGSPVSRRSARQMGSGHTPSWRLPRALVFSFLAGFVPICKWNVIDYRPSTPYSQHRTIHHLIVFRQVKCLFTDEIQVLVGCASSNYSIQFRERIFFLTLGRHKPITNNFIVGSYELDLQLNFLYSNDFNLFRKKLFFSARFK